MSIPGFLPSERHWRRLTLALLAVATLLGLAVGLRGQPTGEPVTTVTSLEKRVALDLDGTCLEVIEGHVLAAGDILVLGTGAKVELLSAIDGQFWTVVGPGRAAINVRGAPVAGPERPASKIVIGQAVAMVQGGVDLPSDNRRFVGAVMPNRIERKAQPAAGMATHQAPAMDPDPAPAPAPAPAPSTNNFQGINPQKVDDTGSTPALEVPRHSQDPASEVEGPAGRHLSSDGGNGEPRPGDDSEMISAGPSQGKREKAKLDDAGGVVCLLLPCFPRFDGIATIDGRDFDATWHKGAPFIGSTGEWLEYEVPAQRTGTQTWELGLGTGRPQLRVDPTWREVTVRNAFALELQGCHAQAAWMWAKLRDKRESEHPQSAFMTIAEGHLARLRLRLVTLLELPGTPGNGGGRGQ